MSNFKNAFGNSGWIQSLMDKSRGKRRPGDRKRQSALMDLRYRKDVLDNEPMMKKYNKSKESPALGSSDILGGMVKKALASRLAKDKRSILPSKTS